MPFILFYLFIYYYYDYFRPAAPQQSQTSGRRRSPNTKTFTIVSDCEQIAMNVFTIPNGLYTLPIPYKYNILKLSQVRMVFNIFFSAITSSLIVYCHRIGGFEII